MNLPQFEVQTHFSKLSRVEAIHRLLHPESIAIIGASANLDKVNGRPLKHLLEKGYRGQILPVNPKYREIKGLACYPDIESLPSGVDIAIVAVPAADVIAVIESLGERGVAAAVVFSSGFGEMGKEGQLLEASLTDAAQRAGVLLCGPNCLGFINAFENVYATFSQYADGDTGAGPVGFVTQSGAFGTAIAALIREQDLGLGYFINTGNEADLVFAELALAVVEDPRITVVAGYLEGLVNGESLVRLAERCLELNKPLVLTKVGRMGAGARAAASHTGSLAVEDAVFDAVISQYGVLRARNEEQMLDMLEALIQPRRCLGTGLGIATQSGGAGVMMADRAEEVGLRVSSISKATQQRLGQFLPSFGAVNNPVDVTGQFVARPELLREAVITLLDDVDIHVGIVWLQLMTAHVDALVSIFEEIQSRTEKPFLVCWVAAPLQARVKLRQLGIAVYGAGERAVEAAAMMARFHANVERYRSSGFVRIEAASPVPESRLTGVVPTEYASAWLARAGIPMSPITLVQNADEAVDAWKTFRQAVVLKIESPDVTHKTEVGGVVLNLDSEEAVRRGASVLLSNVARSFPAARISGILVQPMAEGHIELVVGAKRDPVFGMMIMVGTGGTMIEVMKDVVFRRAPFDTNEGLCMLEQLRMSALLDGVRGQKGIDRSAVASMLSVLSRWAVAMPRLIELDLNPIRVGQSGPIAVDCVMVLDEAS
ncbi:CoA-binding protein [Advenella sp. S44]|uniref:acetate--CoA ligase family protein n=1 Tax=Advenella sp. S44 TaxID=1982755 RepID=UPI000C297EC0|nr:acetate--CoA ligase family protein [Advenella sp. S44]PJX26149.1 CoA-binding protein [Advenella sp. S44]